MTQEQWERVEQVFHAAAERQEPDRSRFLNAECAGDEVLRREVESLLASLETVGDPIDSVVGAAAAGMVKSQAGQIGPYELSQLIGRGGMGEVYLAYDPRLDRRVAIKLLPPIFTTDPGRVRRFQQEARSASALNHPNILTIFEIGQTPEAHYIATEFVEGVTLRKMLRDGPLPLATVLDVGIQAASALTAAHQAGVIHRDIKPENIMVRPDGYVKVLDFGLAKLLEPESGPGMPPISDSGFGTATGAVVGTANYMSPEQARGQRVDARSDIFALGVVLHEMTTGHAPFSGASPADVMAAILHQQAPSMAATVPAVPAELERIAGKTLRKIREERYQAMQDLMADLKSLRRELDLGTDAAPAAPTPSPSPPQGPRMMRRRTTLWLGAAAAAVLLAGAGLKWTGSGNGAIALESIHMTKVQTPGSALYGMISPDGKSMAVVNAEPDDRRSIWVRQTVAGSGGIRVVPPVAAQSWGLSFSPDGNYVYYTLEEHEHPVGGELFRVPTLGGTARKLLEKISGGVLFSPDGTRMMFVYRLNGTTTLYTADSQGGAVRTIASSSVRNPFWCSAWGPDGKTIVYSQGVYSPAANSVQWQVFSMPAEGGQSHSLTPPQSAPIVGIAAAGPSLWIALAADQETGLHQIWYFTPGQPLKRLTHDLIDYFSVSATADGRTLLATQLNAEGSMWVAENSAGRAAPAPRRIFSKNGAAIGTPGWLGDDRIIYSYALGGRADLWSIGDDGSDPKQLTFGPGSNLAPAVAADRSFIAFVSSRTGTSEIWRMDPDGSRQVQLTRDGPNLSPVVSRDGRWIFYYHGLRDRWFGRRVPSGGGDPVTVTEDAPDQTPIPSPDGRWVAYVTTARLGSWRLVILPFDGGPARSEAVVPAGTGNLLWTEDGKGIYHFIGKGGECDLWRQPVNGAPPEKMTNLQAERISAFDISPNGKRLVYAAGRVGADLLLLTGYR